jgi:hypothetical protein
MRLPVFSSRNYATALLRARSSARNPPATEWIYVTGSLEKKQQRLLPFSRNEILDRKPTSQNAVKEATDSEAPLGLDPDPLGHPTTAPTILSSLTPFGRISLVRHPGSPIWRRPLLVPPPPLFACLSDRCLLTIASFRTIRPQRRARRLARRVPLEVGQSLLGTMVVV